MEGKDFPFVQMDEKGPLRKLLNRAGIMTSDWIQHGWFQTLSTTTVFLSFMVLLLSSYPVAARDSQDLNFALTVYCQIAYCFEVCTLILSNGVSPQKYFTKRFNQFDFLVLLGTLNVIPGSDDLYGILRLLRVFTALKFLQNQVSSLRMVVGAIERSAASITYVMVLLLAVYFQYGMVGCVAFGENDPWHFGGIHRAMLTLFRVSILDNWIEVMYINLLGCDAYGYDHDARRHLCTNSTPWSFFAPFYFMSFVIIATFVMVNLFVGVVTTSMEDAHDDIENEQEIRRKITDAVLKFNVAGSDLAKYREVYDLINTDGGPGIEAIELQEVLQASGVVRTMEQVVASLRAIGGEDLSIDFAEFIEFLVTSSPTKPKSKGAFGMKSGRLGGYRSSKTPPVAAIAVAVDTTGDGNLDSVGFDTTGPVWCVFDVIWCVLLMCLENVECWRLVGAPARF